MMHYNVHKMSTIRQKKPIKKLRNVHIRIYIIESMTNLSENLKLANKSYKYFAEYINFGTHAINLSKYSAMFEFRNIYKKVTFQKQLSVLI